MSVNSFELASYSRVLFKCIFVGLRSYGWRLERAFLVSRFLMTRGLLWNGTLGHSDEQVKVYIIDLKNSTSLYSVYKAIHTNE